MSSQGLSRSLRLLLFVLTVTFVSSFAIGQTNSAAKPTAKETGALAKFKSIERPLTFEENQGQFDSKARFVSRGPGFELMLSPDRARVNVSKPVVTYDARGRRVVRSESAGAVQVTLENSNPKAVLAGEDKLAAKSNYYFGTERAKWHEGVPNYSRIRYSSIYPGIDLVYYGNQQKLEHDFIVSPGADPSQIRLGFSGAKAVRLDKNGDLVMEVGTGELRLLKPIMYQQVGATRKMISGRYRLAADKSASFVLGSYDKRRKLIIDPVLSYSTFLGGSAYDYGYGVAVNGSTVYVAGFTDSSDFVGASNGYQCCGFVAALNVNSGLVYSTYFGASIYGNSGNTLAVDPSGNTYFTGSTSGGLPVVGTMGAVTYQGGQSDGFVASLSPSGSVRYSYYLGGAANDTVSAIAYDPVNSRVVLSGTTQSTNFPVTTSQVPVIQGQLYTSANAGSTWAQTSGSGANALGAMDVQTMLIVPGTLSPTTYYVGSSAGVYVSTDGANWSAINNGLYNVPVYSLANDPSTGDLYAGTSFGIYKYTSEQGFWTWLNAGPQDTVTAVLLNPSTPTTIYAADNNRGFYISTDGGTTWSNNNNGLPADSNGYLYSLSLAVSSTGTLYAAAENNTTTNGTGPSFFTSTDGVNWNATAATGFPQYFFSYGYSNALYLDNATNNLYVLSPNGGAYVSADGGNTWTQLGSTGTGQHSGEYNAIVSDPLTPGTLYAGTDQGLFKSTDSGTTWSEMDSGFNSQSVVALAIDKTATNSSGNTVLYAGAMANQGFVMSLDTSLNTVVSTVFGGDGISPYGYADGTYAYSVATDSQGSIYVTGGTYSSAATLPGSTNGAQPTRIGDQDGYLLKLTSAGNAAWNTFIGGTAYDYGKAVAVGSDGGIVVLGYTGSNDLPVTTGTYQTTCNGCYGDFFAKYSAAGSKIFSTYFAPQGSSLSPQALALDPSSNIYFISSTNAGSGVGKIPLANPLDQPLGTFSRSLVAELSANGSNLLFSTTLGGPTGNTWANSIALDASAAIYLAGYTGDPSFAIAGNPVQSLLNNGTGGSTNTDAFLMQITRTGASNDLAIQLSPTTVNAMAGDLVTFNFTIQNLTATGNGASNVVLETDLPLAGVSIPGGECSLGTPSRCYLGTLAPGATVSGSASTTYASAGSFSNVFTVRTDDDDPVPSNNNAVIAATIAAASQPDLAVTVVPDRNPAGVAELVNFTVTVENHGLGMATGIKLNSTLSGLSAGPFQTIGSQWLHLMPAGTAPDPRDGMSTVYDPNTNSMIMFGGYANNIGETNDVWVLSNANGVGLQTWTKLSPIGNAPDPRYDHTAVYNPSSNRMIMFGGYNDSSSRSENDVWVLTHANGQGGTPQWIQLAPSGSLPGPRESHTATFDVATNTMTIFGGYTGIGSCSSGNDAWTLSNADGSSGTPNWTELATSGTGPETAGGSAVYDPATNRMIVFGGYGFDGAACNDTNTVSILTNANGQGGTPTWLNPPLGSENSPDPREEHVAVYDPASNSMLVYGGIVPSYDGDTDEVWRLSNANAATGAPHWNNLVAPSVTGPREYGAAIFDPSTRSMTVFGGYDDNAGTDVNDTFTLKGWDSTCTQTDYYNISCQLGNLPPGQSTTAVLQVQADSIPPTDDTLTSTATEDQTDVNTADNTGSATIHVDYPDLGVAMSGPAAAAHDANFDYTVIVTNYGPGASQPAEVFVNLDQNLSLYSGSSCDGNYCFVPALAPGQSQAITVTVTAPSAAGAVSSSTSLYNYSGDSNPSNDATGNVVTAISASAGLVTYVSENGYGAVGAPTTLSLDVYNGGPDDANNVTVTLTLPPQLSLGYGAPGCSGTTGTVTCTIGQILYDFDGHANIPVVANYPGVYTLIGTAEDSGSVNPSPDTSSFSFTVTAVPLSVYGPSSFVVSLTDQGQLSTYYFAAQSPHDSAQTGAAPGTSIIDPSGRYMYVKAGGFDAYTSVVDLTVKDEVSRIRGVNGRPVLLTPDGTRLISRLASSTTDALAIVDTSTQQIVKTISLDGIFGDATGVADLNVNSGVIAGNKAYLQIANNNGGFYTTAVVDLATFGVKEVTGTDVHLTIPGSAHSIAAKSDNTKVYALRNNPPELLVIDTSSDTVTTTIPLTSLATATAIVATHDPNDTQGQFAYIGGNTSDQHAIFSIDLSANTFTEAVAYPNFLPDDMLLSDDGTTLEAFHLGDSNGQNNAGNWPAPSLYCDCSPEFTISGYLGGVAGGFVYTNATDSPINDGSSTVAISDVQPASIDNSAASKLSILGSNFAADSKVKIGKLDPVAATFVSSGRLDVTLPALVPEQDAKVIVTLPNRQEIPTGRNVSTIWQTSTSYPPTPQKLTITSNFTLPNPLAILRYGDSSLDLVDTAKNGSDLSTIALPTSLAFSPDGQTAYIAAGAQTTGVQAINLSTGERTSISPPVPNDFVGYQDALATGTDPTDNKAVLYFNSGDGEKYSNALSIVDADSTSPTYNQVKRTISAGDGLYAQGSGALAASPTGPYVYTFADVYVPSGFLRTDLIAYNTANNTAAIVHDIYNSWGAEQVIPNHLRVSPDGNWLVMPGASGGVKAVNISGDPSLATPPTNVVSFSDGTHSFKTFQIVGNRLFALDANTNTVTAFNFLPGSSNFSKLGSVTIPGPGSYYESPLLVDPSGSYVYIALKDQDAIAILDANKVAASDSTALLDEGGDDRGMEALALTPNVNPQVNVSAAFESGSYNNITAGASTNIYGAVSNTSVLDAHQVAVEVTPPSGVSLLSVSWSSSYDSGSCQIGTTVTDCTIPQLSGGDTARFTITFTAPAQTPTTFTLAVLSTQETNVSQTPPGTTAINTTAGADLTVTSTMTSLSGPLTTGQQVSYTVTINNLGPATSGASLHLSQNLTGVTASGVAGIGCSGSSDTDWSCSTDSLPPNTPLTVTVTGTVPPNTSSVYLDASASGPDPNLSNNDVNVTLPVSVTASNQVLVPSTGYGTVSAYDPATLSPIVTNGSGTAGVAPLTVVPMPNGRTSFLVNLRANYISVFDLTVQSEIYRIRSVWPLGAVLTSDASQLVVSDHYGTTLSVYDTSTFQLVKQIPVTGLAANAFIANMFIAGNNLYVISSIPDKIHVVNLTTGAVSTVGPQMTFGFSADRRFAITPDQSTVAAIGGGNASYPATLFLIDSATATLSQTIALPIANTGNQTSLAITPNTGGNVYAYISMGNTLDILDLTSGSQNYGQFAGINVTLPIYPTSSVITSDGSRLVLGQNGPSSVYQNLISAATSSIQTGQPTFVTGYASEGVGIISSVVSSLQPPSNAPQISGLSTSFIVNNVPNTLQINGSGFSSDAVVKIGSANPLTPSNVASDGTQLTVTVPANTPSGYLPVIVIDQNAQGALSGRNVASSPAYLYVSGSTSFTPQTDTFVVNYGTGTLFTFGPNAQSFNSGQPIGIANPWGAALTTNNIGFAVSDSDYTLTSTINYNDVQLSGQTAYGDSIALVPDPNTGRMVALVASIYSPTTNTYDWQLNVVDADPYSPTAETILYSIPAGESANQKRSAFAVTPDGKFAFLAVPLMDGTSDLVVFDLTQRVVTASIPAATLNIDPLVNSMQVSPDGNYLAVANLTSNNIEVLSIATPGNPTPVGSIPISNPNGVTHTHCCNLRIANNQIFAFDPGTMYVSQFNFLPASANFSSIGKVQLPGSLTPVLQGGMAISPDGAYLYVAEADDDAVDVLDATRIVTSDINQALVTRMFSEGTGPASIAVNPVSSAQQFADLSITLTHTPEPVTVGGTITYTVTVTNLGPDASGNVVFTDNLPSGLTFVSTAAGNCSGTTAVTCSLGTLSPNQTVQVDLVVSAAGVTLAGQYTNTVSVGQAGQTVPDPNTANNTASDIATFAQPDLAITASADNTSPSAGGTVQFTVHAINNGQVPSTNTTISGSISAGTITDAGDCTIATATTFSCSIGTLVPNVNSTVIVTATLPASAGSVTFNTSASETETDANTADNAITPITITVGGGADLALSPAGAPVNINGVPTYTVTITNNGPDTAQDVTLKDSLSGFGFVSAVSSVGSCSFNGSVVICALGDLASGAGATVNVSVNPPSNGWASNEFHATSDTPDPAPTNNSVNMGPFGGTVGNTAAGPNVLVDALDPASGMAANFLFSNITKPGLTRVTSSLGTQPPAGYRFGTPALIFDLSTTASYSGPIRVALRLAGLGFHHPNAVRLFHMENGIWVDRTMSLDTAHGMITGMTSSLSPFALVEPLNSIPVANAGGDQTLAGANANGASVTLSGATSTDADGDPLTYTWTGPFPEGNGTVTGVNPKVTLPLGMSKVALVVNDGEDNSSPAAVNVTVSDFLVAAPAGQIVLARGQSTSFNVVLMPKYGDFNQPVTVACGNLPAGLTCAVKDDSAIPGSQGTSVTVTLTASASASLRNNAAPLFALWFGGVPVFGILLTGKLKRDRRTMFILLAIVIVLIVALVGCGATGSSSATQPPSSPSGTTTTITLTGTSGDLQHSSTATVTIQ